MKKRRVIIAAAICLLLTGCTSLSLNSPEILTPPKPEGSQREIRDLITDSAGSSYEMIYPEDGEFKSSVIFTNLDDDGDDEAIALYTCDKENIRILIADINNGRYSLLTEGSVHATKIGKVETANFGNDAKDVLISYPGSSATLHSLSVLPADGGDQTDMINSCASHVVGDFNGDGTDDLMTVSPADSDNLAAARLYLGSGGTPEEQSSCEISSETKEYLNISFGKICNEISGAVVDAIDTQGKITTQILCYDYNQRSIINPLYVNDGFDKTKRSAAVSSADIDRDGIIEIPLCETMDYSADEDESTVCDRINWSNYEYTQASFTTKQSAILCEKLGFLLNLSPEHADIVTARYTGENAMSVYLWEYKRSTAERSTKLLTVKRYEKESYNSDTVLEAVASQSNKYVYTYVIEADEGYYGYTDDEVKNNIVLIEDRTNDGSQK